jgi:hypothetical protein
VIARTAVRALAATLPVGVRERYREEWLADVAAAPELGASPWSVVGGALGVAVGLDRENPLVSGMPPRRLAFRRLRVALAGLATTLLLLLLGWWWGAWAELDSRGLAPLAGVSWAGRLILALAAVSGTVAVIAAFGVLRASRRARGRHRWGAADVAVAVTLPLAIAATVLVPFVGLPLAAAGLLALLVVLVAEDPRTQAPALRRPAAVALALVSAGGILAMLAGSLLHVYVWNPLARMPGMRLDEIYAGLAAAGELPSPVVPIAWTALWCTAVLALPVLAALPHPRIRRLATARRLAGIGILGVALVAGGSWFVGFGMGMGMADAFATSGGDAAISGPLIGVIGFGYAIAAVLLGLLPSRVHPTGAAAE